MDSLLNWHLSFLLSSLILSFIIHENILSNKKKEQEYFFLTLSINDVRWVFGLLAPVTWQILLVFFYFFKSIICLFDNTKLNSGICNSASLAFRIPVVQVSRQLRTESMDKCLIALQRRWCVASLLWCTFLSLHRQHLIIWFVVRKEI